jgi:hypothetical protein
VEKAVRENVVVGIKSRKMAAAVKRNERFELVFRLISIR